MRVTRVLASRKKSLLVAGGVLLAIVCLALGANALRQPKSILERYDKTYNVGVKAGEVVGGPLKIKARVGENVAINFTPKDLKGGEEELLISLEGHLANTELYPTAGSMAVLSTKFDKAGTFKILALEEDDWEEGGDKGSGAHEPVAQKVLGTIEVRKK